MLLDHKVIVVVPVGRQQNMEILFPYLIRDKGIIDEVHLWLNTKNPPDVKYIYEQAEINNWRVIEGIGDPPDSPYFYHFPVGHFYQFCNQPKTVYLKCDDDICFIEKGTIEELVRFRIENPKPYLVYPNIVNNVIISHLHQRMGLFTTDLGICTYDSHCQNGLHNGNIASEIHRNFIRRYCEQRLDDYKFNQWSFWDNIRVSINFIAFFAKDIEDYELESDDELILSQQIPILLNRPCLVYGKKLVSHFSFGPQRPFADEELILEKYKEIMRLEC